MTGSGRLDLYRQFKHEYVARLKPALVTIGPALYLSINGQGKPGSAEFQAGIQAMYSVAFTIKMTWKFSGKQDYKVCHLEGLYPDRESADGTMKWNLLMRTPEFITGEHLAAAKQRLEQKSAGKAGDASMLYKDVTLETISEGQCVQMLHVGPYDAVCKTVDLIKQFAAESKLSLAGPLHEIYLSDPRRVEPERLRTIVRIPVR